MNFDKLPSDIKRKIFDINRRLAEVEKNKMKYNEVVNDVNRYWQRTKYGCYERYIVEIHSRDYPDDDALEQYRTNNLNRARHRFQEYVDTMATPGHENWHRVVIEDWEDDDEMVELEMYVNPAHVEDDE